MRRCVNGSGLSQAKLSRVVESALVTADRTGVNLDALDPVRAGTLDIFGTRTVICRAIGISYNSLDSFREYLASQGEEAIWHYPIAYWEKGPTTASSKERIEVLYGCNLANVRRYLPGFYQAAMERRRAGGRAAMQVKPQARMPE
jgi:hypothetical protein